MEIRVFTPPDGENGFVPVLLTVSAPSVHMSEHVRRPGAFDITIPEDACGAEEFQKNRVVLINGYYCGIIEDVIRTADSEGRKVNIKGRDLKLLLANRIALPAAYQAPSALAGYDAVTGTTEGCIKHFWDVNIQSSPYATRRIPGFTIAPDRGRGLSDDKYKARHQPLADITAELAEEPRLIITTRADLLNGQFLFDVESPPDRTRSGSDPIVFSLDYRNVLSMEHQDVTSSGSNLFYATRSGDQYADEALTLMYYRDGEPSEPAGILRREKHINVSSDTPFPGDEYNEMRRQALHDMEGFLSTASLVCTINPARTVYRKDFNLGDIVTVFNRQWGVEMDAQITAVETSVDGNNTTTSVTFGDKKPNFIRRLEREIKNT